MGAHGFLPQICDPRNLPKIWRRRVPPTDFCQRNPPKVEAHRFPPQDFYRRFCITDRPSKVLVKYHLPKIWYQIWLVKHGEKGMKIPVHKPRIENPKPWVRGQRPWITKHGSSIWRHRPMPGHDKLLVTPRGAHSVEWTPVSVNLRNRKKIWDSRDFSPE